MFQDVGYSNYTVEGTEFICMKKAHPDGEFDRFYGDNPQLEYAQVCPLFSAGEAIQMDVEGEDWGNLTEDQKSIHDAYKELP